ncbi:hypothetical protein Taro_018525 [Colocasia esculenta]|uniref:Uncharacterized protein n=1 Tax=Colocasia esculenta TaxID=4460 RepID=A0A843UWG1_COLES|nr:hypothetical protein [Colocasia esculenta]
MAGVGGLWEGTLSRHHNEGVIPTAAMIWDLVNVRATSTAEDQFRRDLVEHVSEAMEAFVGLRVNRSVFLRSVMHGVLEETEYKVEIYKSRADGGCGAAEVPRKRGICGEFHVAHPTTEYKWVVAELPRVFVRRLEDLR